MSALRADGIPTKVTLDELFASEVNQLVAATNEHADELDQLTPQVLALLQRAQAAGKTLYPLALPQAVAAGQWYVTDSGIWQAKQNFNASAAPAAGAYWLLVATFAGQASSLPTSGISDATAAGRAMLTAESAAAQRALVNNPKIQAGAYGAHPAFITTDSPTDGLYQWVIKSVLAVAGAQVAAPAMPAPTVTGFLPTAGAVGTTVTIRGSLFTQATEVDFNGTPAPFNIINSTTIQAQVPVGATDGPIAVATDTATGTSAAIFTVGAATTTPTQPTSTKATKPTFGTIDDVNNVVPLTSDYAYDQVRWGIEGQAVQALASNSICSPGNIAGRLFAYVIADAATNRLQSDTVYTSAAFTLAATAPTNNAPTVTLDSPQAGQTLNVGDPVVLNANPADADGNADIKRVDHLDNGVKFAETTGFPHTVQRNLTGGAHSFTARVYDMVGASGLSNAVSVTAQAAAPPAGANGYANANAGNSIPYGLGGTNPGNPGRFEISFQADFTKVIRDAGQSDTITYTNHCVPSSTTQDAFDSIKQWFPAFYAANQNAKCITVGVFDSFNMVRQNPNWTPAQEVALLKEISAYVKSFGSNVRFITWTPPFDYAVNPDATLDRAGINDELDAVADAIRAEFNSGSGAFDAIADVRRETQLDPSNRTWSEDGIHYKDAGQDMLAQRIAWTDRQAVFGTPQPAALLKAADNYAVGSKVLTLGLPDGNKLAVSGATIKVASTGAADYNNFGSDKYYLAAGQSGGYMSKYLVGDQDFVMTLAANSNPVGVSSFPYPVWVAANGALNTKVNGVNTALTTLTNGTYWGEWRDAATGKVHIFTSPDNALNASGRPVNMAIAYTYDNNFTGAAYIKGNGSGFTGQISYLQGLNTVLIPGQSASGEGPYTGVLAFNKRESDVSVDAAGNLTGGGGAAYSPTSTIAAGTSGGVGMKVTDTSGYSAFLMLTTPDYYDIRQGYTSVGCYAGIGFRKDKLGVINNGHFSELSLTIAMGEEYRVYRNKDTSAITVDVKRVGASTWTVGIYTFDYTSAGELVATAHFNDSPSTINTPTAIGSTLR